MNLALGGACVLLPLLWQVSVRVCCSWDQTHSFRRVQKLILCHAVRVMMWSSVLCLIASKRDQLKYRLPARGIPSPPKAPLKGRRGTSSHGRCLNGVRFIIAPRPPVFVSVPFF